MGVEADAADSRSTFISEFRPLLKTLGLVVGLIAGIAMLWQGAVIFGPTWALHQGNGEGHSFCHPDPTDAFLTMP